MYRNCRVGYEAVHLVLMVIKGRTVKSEIIIELVS